jgi:Fe-S-cluster-containing hydrogenase component 2
MCETACAFFHSGKVNRHLSRIKLINLYEIGIDGPVLCVQCSERYCLDCPEKAITVGDLGEIVVSMTNCVLCKKCERNCPIGAIEIFDNMVLVCDLCGGTPKCVKACTEKALTYIKDDREKESLAEIKRLSSKMNTSEKRVLYINKIGKKIREDWDQSHKSTVET